MGIKTQTRKSEMKHVLHLGNLRRGYGKGAMQFGVTFHRQSKSEEAHITLLERMEPGKDVNMSPAGNNYLVRAKKVHRKERLVEEMAKTTGKGPYCLMSGG